MELSRPISVRASERYLAALRELAWRRRTTIADLTRNAIDAGLGDELREVLSSLAEGGHHNIHSDNTEGEADRA